MDHLGHRCAPTDPPRVAAVGAGLAGLACARGGGVRASSRGMLHATTDDPIRRLARIADRSTCRLTHSGRKSGRPYQVTIWFVVDGDDLVVATARATRQWVRNVQARPEVTIDVGGERFSGTVERIREPAGERRVMDLVAAKYWYLRPFVALARLAGFDPTPDASFRVRLAGAH